MSRISTSGFSAAALRSASGPSSARYVRLLEDHLRSRSVRIASRHDDDRRLRQLRLLEVLQQFEAAVARKHQIEHEQVRLQLERLALALGAVLGGFDAPAFFFDQDGEEFAYAFVVVNDEDQPGFSHGVNSTKSALSLQGRGPDVKGSGRAGRGTA
jgi:hypothetical protein